MESKIVKRENKRNYQRKELTAKQEKFCQEYMNNGGNSAQALRDSYDVENMKESAVYNMAYKALLNPMIMERLHELKREHGKKYAIDREFITENLLYALTIARDQKKLDCMRRTAVEIAKLHGLVIEKQDVNMNNNLTVMKHVELDGSKLIFDTGLNAPAETQVIEHQPQVIDISEEGAKQDVSDLL